MDGEREDIAPALEDALITPELAGRPPRPHDHAAEARALIELAGELAVSPRGVLQKLTDVIVELCLADSAGISIVQGEGKDRRFDWPAVSGRWADKAGDTMPLDASPCGVVIARDATLLFEHPERFFPAAAQEPRIREILLVPFHVDDEPVGTLWAIAHEAGRKFDAEDARLLTGLSRFASAAYQLTAALDEAEAGRREREEGIRARAREESEERYRLLVDSIDEGFCIIEMLFDASGEPVDYRFLQTNAAFERHTGLVDAAGKTMLALAPAHERHWFEIYGRVAMTGEPIRFEDEAAALGRWYDVYACRTGDPEQRRVAILFRDILPRKRAERALREREAELARTQRIGQVASVDVALTTPPIGHRSLEYRLLHGLPRDRAVESHEEWLARIHPDDRARADQEFTAAIAGGDVLESEYRIVRPIDGEERWISVKGLIERDAHGVATRLRGAHIDITERKRAEAALRGSEERQAFLLRLSDALRPLDDAMAIERTAMDMLGRKLGVSRAFYAAIESDGDTGIVRYAYTDGVPSGVGRYSLAAFRPARIPEWRAGHVTMTADSETDPTFDDAERAAYASVASRAAVGVPLIKGGRLVALLAINQSTPRRWTEQDITLAVDVAERTWTAVERANAEAALAQSETRFRALVSAGTYSIYRMSPDWRLMYQLDSDTLANTSGPIEDWVDKYILKEDRAAVFAETERAIRTRTLFELEHRVLLEDGSIGWVLSRAVPLYGPGGEIVEWFGAGSDVTQRKRAEQALRESEERLRQFGENSPDTLWVLDAEASRLEYLSAAYERIWGEPRERVINDLAHWREHVHPDDRERVAQGLPLLLQGQRHSMEYRIVRPDGEQRWIFDTGFAITDEAGRILRLAGVAQDLTARHAAEERVRESERRFRTLSEGVPQLVWRSVGYGEWSWASPQWTNFTGQPEVESHGRGWLEMVHPDDRGMACAAWERSKITNTFAVDYRLRHAADGRYRWFTTRATPVYDDDRRLIEWLGTSTDVDDLRRLQGHQLLLLGELQHRVRNSLAVIRSIARRTGETSENVEEFGMHLDGRLASFARTQAAVTRDPAGGVDLKAIVTDELLAHLAREGEHAHIAGPAFKLQPKAGELLALGFHELATNAVKYGALSVPDGVVRVSWRVEDDGMGQETLAIVWDESRPGASVSTPTRRGFGSELLEDTLGYELEAETVLVFRATGLLCTITIPLTELVGVLI